MDKTSVIAKIIRELERQKTELETGLASAKQAAMESPGAMQSHSDTTKSQMHNLAANIEKLVKEKAAAIGILTNLPGSPSGGYRRVEIGALTEVEGQDGQKLFYLVAPQGGAGATIIHEDATIISITLATPLGMTLSGKTGGETAVLKTRTGERRMKIKNIS